LFSILESLEGLNLEREKTTADTIVVAFSPQVCTIVLFVIGNGMRLFVVKEYVCINFLEEKYTSVVSV